MKNKVKAKEKIQIASDSLNTSNTYKCDLSKPFRCGSFDVEHPIRSPLIVIGILFTITLAGFLLSLILSLKNNEISEGLPLVIVSAVLVLLMVFLGIVLIKQNFAKKEKIMIILKNSNIYLAEIVNIRKESWRKSTYFVEVKYLFQYDKLKTQIRVEEPALKIGQKIAVGFGDSIDCVLTECTLI